jgi:hypothetical protein
MACMVSAPKPGERADIEDGAALLARCSESMARIARLSGASATQFAATYRPLLVKWATYLQRLPDVDAPGATLLERRLRWAEQVLARRQGVILPIGTEPERAAREADLWTFAVFSVALLRRLGTALAPLAVALWSAQHQAVGRWRPDLHPRGLASVENAAAYSVFPNAASPCTEWALLAAGALLDNVARDWLWREPSVLAVWKQALVAPALPPPIQALFSVEPASGARSL